MIRRLTKPVPTSRSVSRPTTPCDKVRFFFPCRINSWATAMLHRLIAKPPRAMCEPSGIDRTTSATVFTLSAMVLRFAEFCRLPERREAIKNRLADAMLESAVMFETRFQTYWPDGDAAGIVYFPHFFRYAEQAEEELFRAAGQERKRLIEENHVW